MTSPLPPDPYQALGVAKDATAAQIKTTYRKLVLRCHPDKILDPAKKQAAADDFHKIQTAYEIIGDEQRRQRYDAAIKLAELRRAAMEERSRRPAARDDPYSRPYTTAEATPRSYAARERVYEERRPEHAYDRRPSDSYGSDYPYDLPPRATSRKEDDRYDRASSNKRSPPKTDRERTREKARSSKESVSRGKDKARRTEREIKREREEIKRDREWKYTPSAQSSPSESGSDSPYERQRSRAHEEAQRFKQAEDARRKVREEEEVRQRLREEDEQRRRAYEDEEHRRARDAYYEMGRRQAQTSQRRGPDDPASRADKFFQAEVDARNYMRRAHDQQDDREVSPARSAKDKTEVVRDKYGRPVQIRRGTGKTKPAEKPKSSSKDKVSEKARSREQEVPRTKVHDIVDEDMPRRPATLNQSYSSPETIRIPDTIPVFDDKQRSSSMDQRRERDNPGFKPPQMRRAETMPVPRTSFPTASKKTTTAPTRSSNLRTQTNSAQAVPQQMPTYELRPESVQQPASKATAAPKKAVPTTSTRPPIARATEMKYGQPTPQASPAYDSAPEFEYPNAKAAYARDDATDSEEEIVPKIRRAATFKTEVREPLNGQPSSRERYTRSPEPMAEPVRDTYREQSRNSTRESGRAASSRYAERPKANPAQRGETRSASHFVKTADYESDSRPKISRTESARTTKNERALYGEIPRVAGSPKVQQSRHAAPMDADRYADVRPATGYPYTSSSRRPSATVRPGYGSRQSSYNQRTAVYA